MSYFPPSGNNCNLYFGTALPVTPGNACNLYFEGATVPVPLGAGASMVMAPAIVRTVNVTEKASAIVAAAHQTLVGATRKCSMVLTAIAQKLVTPIFPILSMLLSAKTINMAQSSFFAAITMATSMMRTVPFKVTLAASMVMGATVSTVKLTLYYASLLASAVMTTAENVVAEVTLALAGATMGTSFTKLVGRIQQLTLNAVMTMAAVEHVLVKSMQPVVSMLMAVSLATRMNTLYYSALAASITMATLEQAKVGAKRLASMVLTTSFTYIHFFHYIVALTASMVLTTIVTPVKRTVYYAMLAASAIMSANRIVKVKVTEGIASVTLAIESFTASMFILNYQSLSASVTMATSVATHHFFQYQQALSAAMTVALHSLVLSFVQPCNVMASMAMSTSKVVMVKVKRLVALPVAFLSMVRVVAITRRTAGGAFMLVKRIRLISRTRALTVTMTASAIEPVIRALSLAVSVVVTAIENVQVNSAQFAGLVLTTSAQKLLAIKVVVGATITAAKSVTVGINRLLQIELNVRVARQMASNYLASLPLTPTHNVEVSVTESAGVTLTATLGTAITRLLELFAGVMLTTTQQIISLFNRLVAVVLTTSSVRFVSITAQIAEISLHIRRKTVRVLPVRLAQMVLTTSFVQKLVGKGPLAILAIYLQLKLPPAISVYTKPKDVDVTYD